MGRLFAALLIAAVAANISAHAVAQVGTAVSVVPAATNVRAGTPRTLAIADAIEQNDRIRTGPSGATRIQFRDETILTISANADLGIDRSVFDGSEARSLTVDLAKGALRFVSGLSAPRSYQVNTPVVVIGIRGTNFSVMVREVNRVPRVVTDVTDAQIVVCPRSVPLPDPSTPPEQVRAAGCREVRAGDPALAATPRGFSQATQQETAQLWRLLDGAHIALDRRIGRDPSAYQEAASLGDTITTRPISFPALGPFASSRLLTGIPDFAGVDVVQNAVILPPQPQPQPQPQLQPQPQPEPIREFPLLGGFGAGSYPTLFAEPTADRAIVTFRPGSVDRIELQNGQIRQRGAADPPAADAFFDVIGLERWTGGTVSDGRGSSVALTGNESLHVLYGNPATNIPMSGTVEYNLDRSTRPTSANPGRPLGVVDNGELSIAFTPTITNSEVNFTLGVRTTRTDLENSAYHTIATRAYGDSTQGAILLQSNGRFSSGGATIPVSVDTESGPSDACPDGAAACRASAEGFIAGSGASRAGLIYQFGQADRLGERVTGAATFRLRPPGGD
jgi:hypothetical protein